MPCQTLLNVLPLSKKQTFERALKEHGRAPLLHLLKEFEQEERYEDCKLISEVLKTGQASQLNKSRYKSKEIEKIADKIRCSIAGMDEIRGMAKQFASKMFDFSFYEYDCKMCGQRNCLSNDCCTKCGDKNKNKQ